LQREYVSHERHRAGHLTTSAGVEVPGLDGSRRRRRPRAIASWANCTPLSLLVNDGLLGEPHGLRPRRPGQARVPGRLHGCRLRERLAARLLRRTTPVR
jgi:hypothetical protein